MITYPPGVLGVVSRQAAVLIVGLVFYSTNHAVPITTSVKTGHENKLAFGIIFRLSPPPGPHESSDLTRRSMTFAIWEATTTDR